MEHLHFQVEHLADYFLQFVQVTFPRINVRIAEGFRNRSVVEIIKAPEFNTLVAGMEEMSMKVEQSLVEMWV